ncbi:hypothetical protein [Pseudomonas putida]|uniref:hypothetical protein n=1 Tax=Pseudomonas putida TaxID=303 RepID=UPI0012AD15C3|nr:hypothetical protein [Pseudomonas putida]
MAQLTTTARFECPECKKSASVTVDVPEVDWCVEPLSDSLSEDDTDIECNECGAPFSVHVQNSPAGCFVELDEYPHVEVHADEAPFSADGPGEDDWLNDYTPPNPFDVFESNQHHLGDVLAEYGIGGTGVLKRSASIINRMVFAETISAMEAYLGDTLLRAVLKDSSAMQRLVAEDKELSAEKISLNDILENPKIVEERVQTYLRGLLYHNLAKIEVIFSIALQIEIFPDKDLKRRLHKTIVLRHDVVHRNGRDKEGNQQYFSTERVEETMDDVKAFVTHVENSVDALGQRVPPQTK